MLRSLPTTLLVYLVFCLLITAQGTALANDPDKSLEVLLKPSNTTDAPIVRTQQAKARRSYARRAMPAPYMVMPGAKPIVKVRPPKCVPAAYAPGAPLCVLPKQRPRQWEMEAQVFWARARGKIAYPRNSQYAYGYGYDNQVDLTDDLGARKSPALTSLSAKYQFRCSWAIRYSAVFSNELGGSATPDRQFVFGPGTTGFYTFGSGQELNSKWEHSYQRVGLVYDAIKKCNSKVAVFGDWVHTDDKIQLNCSYCGNYQSPVFSEASDMAMIGLEFERCFRTAFNGGTLSFDNRAGFMFMGDSEGWDVQTGMKYSIPLSCGRWGYTKGGYRYLEIKKSNESLIWEHAFEGGFLELGFVF